MATLIVSGLLLLPAVAGSRLSRDGTAAQAHLGASAGASALEQIAERLHLRRNAETASASAQTSERTLSSKKGGRSKKEKSDDDAASSDDGYTVTLASGAKVNAEELSKWGVDMRLFKFIRYAKAARFQAPTLWDEKEDAVFPEFVKCAQGGDKIDGADDCHHLSIVAPPKKLAKDAATIVWIHGGGLASGPGGEEMVESFSLLTAEHQLIVAAPLYRLNFLGFYTGDGATTNNGVRDTITALQWLKKNIGRFGGDPAKLTTYGESGGAMMSYMVYASPMAKGLLHGAIACSAGVASRYPQRPSKPTAANLGTMAAEAAGCTNKADQTQCLAKLPMEKLGPAVKLYTSTPLSDGGATDFTGYDGEVIGSSLYGDACAGKEVGSAGDVPLMILSHRFETRFYAQLMSFAYPAARDLDLFLSLWVEGYKDLAAEKKEQVKAFLLDKFKGTPSDCPNCAALDKVLALEWSQVATQLSFTIPAMLFSSVPGAPKYRVNMALGGPAGSIHGLNVAYLQERDPTKSAFAGLVGTDKAMEKVIAAAKLRSMWADFAKKGSPGHGLKPTDLEKFPLLGLPMIEVNTHGSQEDILKMTDQNWYINGTAQLFSDLACGKMAVDGSGNLAKKR